MPMKNHHIAHRQTRTTPSLSPLRSTGYRLAILTFFAIFLIFVLLGLAFLAKSAGHEYDRIELSALSQTEKSTFLFPTQKDTLIKGQTYTLRWHGGPPTIEAMFLINKALQKEGVSVSIADRAYNIKNTGSYQFTVPTNIPDGLYQIEAGPLTSDYFEIKSK